MTGGIVSCEACNGRGTDAGCKKCGAKTVKSVPLEPTRKAKKAAAKKTERRRGGKK